jgi:hypothetical protein
VFKPCFVHDWWFSPGTPASSNTKTGRHDIAKILLKVALKHHKVKIKSNHHLIIDYVKFIEPPGPLLTSDDHVINIVERNVDIDYSFVFKQVF